MYKILVIEDEKNIRYSIQEILLFSGYDVMLAENGLVGLQILKHQKFDLILCDVMMPEMEALESEIKTLRKENELSWEQVSFARDLVETIESSLNSVTSAKQAREAFKRALENSYFEM